MKIRQIVIAVMVISAVLVLSSEARTEAKKISAGGQGSIMVGIDDSSTVMLLGQGGYFINKNMQISGVPFISGTASGSTSSATEGLTGQASYFINPDDPKHNYHVDAGLGFLSSVISMEATPYSSASSMDFTFFLLTFGGGLWYQMTEGTFFTPSMMFQVPMSSDAMSPGVSFIFSFGFTSLF